MQLPHKPGMTGVKTAILLNKQIIFVIDVLAKDLRYWNPERLPLCRGDPQALIPIHGSATFVEQHICRVRLSLSSVAIICESAEGSWCYFRRIERSHVAVVKFHPRRHCATFGARPFTGVGVIVAVLTCSCMNKHTNQIEHVLLAWRGWIAKMVDMVSANIDRPGEFEMVIDLSSAKVVQVELEALEVEDKVVRHVLETGPIIVSFA